MFFWDRACRLVVQDNDNNVQSRKCLILESMLSINRLPD